MIIADTILEAVSIAVAIARAAGIVGRNALLDTLAYAVVRNDDAAVAAWAIRERLAGTRTNLFAAVEERTCGTIFIAVTRTVA